jgi:thymidylate kinase
MISVALIGPDGAGKSTVTERLEREPLPAPVKRIYMGVNLQAGGLMLPTTRLALALKTARGRRPDMVAAFDQPAPTTGSAARRAAKGSARIARLLMWLAEEWFRQLIAEYHLRRGFIVVFDRHFYADYFHQDVEGTGSRPITARVHGYLLRSVYPKPDLVICLDAPGRVLFDRKREASAEWLERRRAQYLQLANEVPHFVVVDATRPLDAVTRDVVTAISEFLEKRGRP